MQSIEYILAHGSRNLFVMIDALREPIEGGTKDAGDFVRAVCETFSSDGLLFLERDEEQPQYYAMNMYNTDGTRAEMCGNGMRLVARFADERYLNAERFTLCSGGREYPIYRADKSVTKLNDGSEVQIPNYAVRINIRTASKDFTLSSESFVGERIEQLDEELRFTYLNLGNPHIVAQVPDIDLEKLNQLGERVKELTDIFPYGVNVSMMQPMGDQQIFVATYERGVGLTASCGTAMTASSTTAALLGICRWGEAIEVRNRGGFVKCLCTRSDEGELTTELIGNATYIERGVIRYSKETQSVEREVIEHFTKETEAWECATANIL